MAGSRPSEERIEELGAGAARPPGAEDVIEFSAEAQAAAAGEAAVQEAEAGAGLLDDRFINP